MPLPLIRLALAAALALIGPARAEIVVSPLRQVITAKSPAAAYEIVNPSSRIVDARVGWVDLAADADGYAPASPAVRAVLSAAPYLVVEPASFRLEPGGRAAIRVRLKEGAPVPPGERRSHLLIETAAARTSLRKAGGGLEVDVGLGVSTPVILRGRCAPPKVAFADTLLLRNDDGLLDLATTLRRKGPSCSAYGRLVVSLATGNAERILAELDNIAVYSDTEERRVRAPLNRETLPAGRLTLRYAGAAEYEGSLFAEKFFEIAPP